jgi:hypothetical protein
MGYLLLALGVAGTVFYAAIVISVIVRADI